MKVKIIGAVFLLWGMSFSVPAFAQYPGSGGIVNFDETYDAAQTQSWVPSNPENIFMVDGKRFILLDTDEEGNYFVLTEDHYGTYPFEQNIPNTVPLAQAVTVDGKTTITDKGADLEDTESWRFAPQRPANVGYWLNHAFVSTGNTDEFQLPRQVYDHILERTWEVEGFRCFAGWTALQYFDRPLGVNAAADYAAAFSGDSYKVTGKISLLSYNEYMSYKDKIGITFNNSGGWSGMLLRTCDSMVTCREEGEKKLLNLVRSPLMVRTRSANPEDHGALAIRTADAISSDYYYIRPCFWLSKDFFKNVACDITWEENETISIGAAPLAKIRSYSYEELRSIYTDGQLESMGYQTLKRSRSSYPAHSGEKKDLGAGERGSTGLPAYYSAPAENLFTVDGKTFILLDRDRGGNYLIMANEEYGQHWFSTGAITGDKQCTDRNWYFDPENEKSIAYWLNHQFLETGGQMKFNPERLILPAAVRQNMILSAWETEPHYPIDGWTVGSYASEATKAEIEQWHSRQLVAAEKRTVICKVALLSYTEYQQYKDKIGLSVLADGYGGFLLRTPRTQTVAAPEGTWSVITGPLQVANNDSAKELVFSTAGVDNDVYYIRPVFWLSKDFFAKYPVEIDSMGSAVKNELAHSYDYFDMRHIYSQEQMRRLGIRHSRERTDAVPGAGNVIISGVPAIGGTVTGSYRYRSNDLKSSAAAERNSKYAWYRSDTENGPKTVCSHQISYTPRAEDAGKYLWFGVTPQNAYGISADREYVSRPVFVEDKGEIQVESLVLLDEGGNQVSALNGVPVLNLYLSVKTERECVAVAAVYSQDGKMTAFQSEIIEAGTSTKKITLSGLPGGGGAYGRIMLFAAEDFTKPVYSKKI